MVPGSSHRLSCLATLLCLRLCRHRCPTTKFCAPHRTSKQRELEMQMAIVLLVITIVFVLSWSPLDLRLFMNQIWPHRTREDHLQDLISVRLTSINQIIDPWAYIICRKLFSSRVWRWVRLPLLGRSWLLRRESSSVLQGGGGSRKKVSGPDGEKKCCRRRGGGGGGGPQREGDASPLPRPPRLPRRARETISRPRMWSRSSRTREQDPTTRRRLFVVTQERATVT
ncbi:uncharacterized protein LOC119576029 [Penaeus monodon]|uniref:uncharacterized protein LOC119576029 n=1 Tax=Penaeus monodon TaxID=6687 RepID=UPI0018A75141|nr:uncharacterized protein LOC119576029 [Penaeus monodon]